MQLKKISVISTILATSLILCSCSIPFNHLLDNNIDSGKEVTIEGIKLSSPSKNFEDVKKYKEKLKAIFSVIGDNEFYLKNFNDKAKFYEPVKTYFNNEYLDKIKSGESKNILGQTMDNIYYNDNTKFKEIRIIGIGGTLNSTKLEIEVVSIDDTMSFGLQGLYVYFDNNDLINNVEVSSNLTKNQNTTKEIEEDSLLENDNSDFMNTFNEFIKPLKNKSLYKSMLNTEEKQTSEYELNILIDNLEIKNKDIETIKTLFMAGKGEFNNYGLIEYMNYDKNAIPTTLYKIRFPYNEEYIDFTFSYNRLEKAITKISI